MEFEVTIPVPLWMYIDNTILDMYACEMWRNIVRMAGLLSDELPDIRYAPHPTRFDAINVCGKIVPPSEHLMPPEDPTERFRREVASAFDVQYGVIMPLRDVGVMSITIPEAQPLRSWETSTYDDGEYDEWWSDSADAAHWHPGLMDQQ